MSSFLRLSVFLLIVIAVQGRAQGTEAAFRETAQMLPSKLAKLTAALERKFAGSTLEMCEAAHTVAEGLLPDLIELLAGGLNDAAKTEIREEIERDASGVASDVYYSGHATGWGGTLTSFEAAEAKPAGGNPLTIGWVWRGRGRSLSGKVRADFADQSGISLIDRE